MKITIVYFGSLSEKLSLSSEEVELPQSVTKISNLKELLVSRGGKWIEQFDDLKKIKCAMNYDYIQNDALLIDGAEVAFFPPVTGG